MDEAAFGYNASLISQTLRDENGRFLPVFVLSLDGRDWRQPVTQYFQVLTFKIFGGSLFNLKFTSVVIISLSAVLIFLLGQQILNRKFALLGLLIFLTTPIIMIHSHLALDNIMPLPFILLWLFGLFNFQKKKSLKYLVLSGISLGISFYAHKSMRSAAPVWTILTVVYLSVMEIKNWKPFKFKAYLPVIIFIAAVSPFYLVSKILDIKYAGAVFGAQDLTVKSWYDFFYFYISSFDISFLFIKGDSIMHHSTGKHGMFLLSSLPLFVYGLYKGISTGNRFLVFLIICFFAGPLFLGFIGSVHRASRIIFLVPLFSVIAAFGLYELLKFKAKIIKGTLLIFAVIFTINYFDFVKYYWYQYPQDTYHIFYSPSGIPAYKKLYDVSTQENLRPLIAESLVKVNGDAGAVEDFSRSLYFVKPEIWDGRSEIPEGSVLLTQEKDLPGEPVDTGVKDYYLFRY